MGQMVHTYQKKIKFCIRYCFLKDPLWHMRDVAGRLKMGRILHVISFP